MVTADYSRDFWGRMKRSAVNFNTLLVTLVIVLIVGQFVTAWQQAQPPLIYSRTVYTAIPSTVKPGDVMEWVSHLNVVDAEVTLITNYSIWNETCHRPAWAGSAATQRQQYVPETVPDMAVDNHVLVPVLAPGAYRLTRTTWGLKGGGATASASYDVFFTVSGPVGDCMTFERQ